MAPVPKKKGEEDEYLSEEDLALKQRWELYVERIQDSDPGLQKDALESLWQEICTSASPITSFPEILKFLRCHYGSLKSYYEAMEDSDMKKSLADILSVVAITLWDDSGLESLKYRVSGTQGDIDIGPLANLYVMNLTLEALKAEDDLDPVFDLTGLLEEQIVAFHMKHSVEYEAVDIIIDLEWVEGLHLIRKNLDNANYKRTCLYLKNFARYFTRPDDLAVLDYTYRFYLQFEDYPSALQMALLIRREKGDRVKRQSYYVRKIFTSCEDLLLKKQLCYILGRHGVMFKFEEDMDSDDEDMATDNEEITADDKERDLLELMRNKKLSEIYLELARGMEVMESKSPEDICKGYLFDERASAGARGYSDGQNLAATFVNAFVNAGFHQDKLMTVPSQVSAGSSSGDWVFKNKEHKKVSAAASLGMIFLWDADAGRAQLDKYLDINDNHVLAGALVGLGIVNCNMGHHSDPARELLRAYVNNGDSTTKIGAMMGLGLAYAGSRSIVIRQKLIPILKDKEAPIEVISFAAISLGLAYVGSCKRQIVSAIKSALWNKRDSILGKPLYRLCLLALCLVYLGKQDALDYEVLAGLDGEFKRYFKITLQSCAYAGSGNVDQVHLLVNRCNMPLWAAGPSQGSAVLGIAMVAMGEELGLEMAIRMLDHFLQYGNLEIRRAVPLALGLLCISNPKVNVMNTLSQLSKDRDIEVAMSAVISLGLIGAGTRNGRIANTLHELSVFYYRSTEPNLHFCIQIAQGLVHLGKGLLTLAPYHSDHFLISPTALAGIIIVLHACLDMKGIILGEYHYILYYLALAMKPRMLMTVDDNLRPLSVPVRVGQAAKPLSVSGPPKTITGSQMHATTPVLLGAGQIAELATEKYIPLSPFLEGVVILKEKPELNEAR